MNAKEREDRLVDFLLNVFADVEDPKGAFLHYFSGEEAFYEHLLAERQALGDADPRRFLAVHTPEMGDYSMRKWLGEVQKRFKV